VARKKQLLFTDSKPVCLKKMNRYSRISKSTTGILKTNYGESTQNGDCHRDLCDRKYHCHNIKDHFLTGTTLTVILALLILLVSPKAESKTLGFSRTCPVCNKRLFRSGNYCSECGSKV
jgi:hypothetical protein